MVKVELSISEYRKRFYISAGLSRLSKGFKSKEDANTELENNRSFYEYWSKSISVSVQNTTPIIRNI